MRRYVGDSGDGCHNEEHHPRREEGLRLFLETKPDVEDPDQDNRYGKDDGYDKLSQKLLHQDEQKEDKDAQVDDPETCTCKNSNW